MNTFFTCLIAMFFKVSIHLANEMIAEYGVSIIKWLVKQMFAWF